MHLFLLAIKLLQNLSMNFNFNKRIFFQFLFSCQSTSPICVFLLSFKCTFVFVSLTWCLINSHIMSLSSSSFKHNSLNIWYPPVNVKNVYSSYGNIWMRLYKNVNYNQTLKTPSADHICIFFSTNSLYLLIWSWNIEPFL